MKHEVSEGVADALRGKMPCLELRGDDKYARKGGDLDFMVPAGHAVGACRLAGAALVAKGWFIAGFRDIGYLAQIILVQPRAVEEDWAIKVDFFDGLRWYGVGSDVAGDLLFEALKSQHENISRLSAAASFFQKLLVVGKLHERDLARIAENDVDNSYLLNIARKLSLPLTESQVKARGVAGVGKWRLRAVSGGANGFFSAIGWFFRASQAHLRFKLGLGQHAGLVIGISGLDGSGKSTLVERLVDLYKVAGTRPPDLVHLLPSWIPLPHQLFRREKTKSNYTRPYSEPPVSSRLSGYLRVVYYIIAFLSARLYLAVQTLRGHVTVLDRSIIDFGSDPTRSRIPFKKLPDWLLRILLPKGKHFYLDASPSVVVARKGELSLEKASSLRIAYLENCSSTNVTRLDGDGTPDSVFLILLGYISSEYQNRIKGLEGKK